MLYTTEAFLSAIVALFIYSLCDTSAEKIAAIQDLIEVSLHVKIAALENRIDEAEKEMLQIATEYSQLQEDYQQTKGDYEYETETYKKLIEDAKPDPGVFQAWTGTFEYMFYGYDKIRGFVEIINTDVFTAAENKQWLASPNTLQRDILVKKLLEAETFAPKTWIVRTRDTCFMDWVGWTGTVTCRVKIYEGRENFSRVEQALQKAPKIVWEKKLITNTQ
jgi:hypothetical protein